MNALIAIALLLTSATQFRLGGLPVGPGEICLAIWIGLSLFRGAPPLSPAFARMSLFWVLLTFAECIGTLNGYAMGDHHDTGLFLHDAMAFPFVGAVGCLLLTEPGAEVRLRRVAWTLLVLAAGSLTLQLGAAWDVLSLPFVEPWFGDRFRGWSNNSNQLAFFCAVLVLVGLHLADDAQRARGRLGAVLCLTPIIIVGRLTKTDSFTFALLASVPVFLVLKLRAWIVAPASGPTPRPIIRILAVLGLPLLIVSFGPLAVSASGSPEQLVMGFMKGGGKEAAGETNLRLELWGEAIDRGLQAHMLGLGPGPHLPVPWSIVAVRTRESSPDVDPHPTLGDAPNFEAHNTFFDLFTQGGLIADVTLVWLIASAFLISYRAHAAGLSALVCGLLVFSLTNFTLREPMFWFGMALALVPFDTRRQRSPEREHGSDWNLAPVYRVRRG
ncbi:MAG: hypothetical protein JOZ05_05225 [Acetobacteraceae bacterium]|nr:hypothetical protein [Acetobacteraceae bacterium]